MVFSHHDHVAVGREEIGVEGVGVYGAGREANLGTAGAHHVDHVVVAALVDVQMPARVEPFEVADEPHAGIGQHAAGGKDPERLSGHAAFGQPPNGLKGVHQALHLGGQGVSACRGDSALVGAHKKRLTKLGLEAPDGF